MIAWPRRPYLVGATSCAKLVPLACLLEFFPCTTTVPRGEKDAWPNPGPGMQTFSFYLALVFIGSCNPDSTTHRCFLLVASPALLSVFPLVYCFFYLVYKENDVLRYALTVKVCIRKLIHHTSEHIFENGTFKLFEFLSKLSPKHHVVVTLR